MSYDKIRNPFTYQRQADAYETTDKPSMTIPDQTLSIREILARYSRGLPIDNTKVPIYDGEDEFYPDPKTLDLADRQAMRESVNQEIYELSKKVKKNATTKPDKKQEQEEKPKSDPSADGDTIKL